MASFRLSYSSILVALLATCWYLPVVSAVEEFYCCETSSCNDNGCGFYSAPTSGCCDDEPERVIDRTSTRVGRAGRRLCECSAEQVCSALSMASCESPTGYVGGDPHFRTWKGEYFDFMGVCDLVLVHAPQFAEGLGLDVHVRTKGRYDYSFIESIAVKIGNEDDDNILQVNSWGNYVLNGVDGAELPGHLGPFTVSHKTVDDDYFQHEFEIFIGENDQRIIIKTFKDWVSIKFPRALAPDFRDSQGLLGDFTTGQRLARDQKTIIENDAEFGMEWQVRPNQDDPSLFLTQKAPQYPTQQCIMPEERMAMKQA